MRKIFAIIVCVMLCACSGACTLKTELPDTVVINGTEYKKAFVNELYPIDELISRENPTKISEARYYEYSTEQFDCYIAYGNGNPNVYFKSEQFDEAVSHYSNAENFSFFCLIGNVHDKNDQQIFELQEVDAKMFDSLLDFSAKNEYNPLTSFNNKEGIYEVPIQNSDKWMADELHFYKKSKDGFFTTQRGYTFVLHEDTLCLLYTYDFSNDDNPVMRLRAVPTEISDYFSSLVKSLQDE